MQRSVVFRADQDGLVILLDNEAEFSTIKADLSDKFEQGDDFFAGNTFVKVELGSRCLSQQQKRELLEIFKAQSGSFVIEFDNSFVSNIDQEETRDSLLIKRTIRSGQSISYNGNVIVEGDINPGAEVVAQGNILVMGEVRGFTHAGAGGDSSCTISAFRLKPIQLRIANYIGRAPDDSSNAPDAAEIAFVKKEQIVIDYLEGRNCDGRKSICCNFW